MAGYQHAGPAKGECYGTRPTSPGVPDTPDITAIEQFHGMLLDAIARRRPRNTPGLKVALHLFEGYFGYFGRKEGK